MEKEKKSDRAPERDFIPESKENIIEGARVFSEKASEIFNSFLEKLRGTAGKAYEKGTEVFENVSLKAQNYYEKYRDRSEMSNLKKVRDDVATQLGNMCYMEYSGRYRFRDEFLKSDEFKSLIAQVRELDKQIIKIGDRLEKEN